MSFNSQSNLEATHHHRTQKRNSTLSSICIAVCCLLVLGILLGLFVIRGSQSEQTHLISYQIAQSPPQDSPTSEPLKPAATAPPIAPSISELQEYLTTTAPSPPDIPVPQELIEPALTFPDLETSHDFNSPPLTRQDKTSQIGNFSLIPKELKERCSQHDRLQRLLKTGGTQRCEDAVMKALRWLKKNQNNDGSWGTQKPVAMTGLALLAFLGHCETPLSVEFGDAVTQGIVYLIDNNLRQNGKSSSDFSDRHWCYEHAIALYALSEAYTFCHQLNLLDIVPHLQEALVGGINWMITNQEQSGAWDYDYANHNRRQGDLSITVWHLQALKAAQATKLRFPKIRLSIRKGLEYLASCQNEEHGGFGYTATRKPYKKGTPYTLTGAGVLCFQQHKGRTYSKARAGIKYIEKNAQFNFTHQQVNLYEHYYNSQAMLNHGGSSWAQYNELFRDELIDHQRADGSWPNGGVRRADPVYTLSLATLMLEVYYRFLPGTGRLD